MEATQLCPPSTAPAAPSVAPAPTFPESDPYWRMLESLSAATYTATLLPAPRRSYVSPRIEALSGFPADDWTGERNRWLRFVQPDLPRLFQEFVPLETTRVVCLPLHSPSDSQGQAGRVPAVETA